MRIELQMPLDDPSIAPLRSAWQRAGARHAGRHLALAHIARERHAALRAEALPAMAREPLNLIPELAELISAPQWSLDARAREEFVGALAYFVDPLDLIPDDDERVGLLDDALVLQLALASAQHEWLAWRDYRDYVAAYPEDAGIDRATWLQRRRERLELELRKRKAEQDYPASGRRESPFGEAGRFAGIAPAPGRFGVR